MSRGGLRHDRATRRCAVALAFFSVSLVGCAAAIPTHRVVREVEIAAPTADIDVDDIPEGLANHPPTGLIFKVEAEFEPLAVDLDRRRIETYFRARGYYLAEVTSSTVSRSREGVRIRYEVEPGPRATLEAVDVQGAPDRAWVDREALERTTELQEGEPISYDDFEAAKERIESRLANRGYAYAEVGARLEVERETGRAVAHYRVEPGPITYFGEVVVKTQGDIPESFITNRIAWDKGERFDPKKLELTRARIFQTGLLADVRFERAEEAPNETLDLVVHTAPGLPHEIRIGAGAGLETAVYEIRGRISYTHRHFLDPLLTLRLEARPAYAFFRSGDGVSGFNWEARAELEREDFLYPRLRSVIGTAYQQIQLEAYTTRGPELSFAVGRQFLNDRLAASLSLSFEYLNFSSVNLLVSEAELVDLGIIDPLPFTYVVPLVSYDGRDDPLSPRSGIYGLLRGEAGYVLTGEASGYLKVTPELRAYLPLGERFVLAARARYGTQLLGLGPLPSPQRYYGGGPEGHRGFGRRRLSPMRPTDEGDMAPVGGEVLFESSLEVRFDLFEAWGQLFGAVAFVDAGDVVLDMDELDLLKLHVAVGPGVRVTTPVGVVRLDVGVRLNRLGPPNPDPDSPVAVHFSLGEAF